MSYKKDNNKSFADYQLGEGFSSAVTGDTEMSIKKVATIAQQNMDSLPAGLQGLKGYEGYSKQLSAYPEFGDSATFEGNPGLAGFGDNPPSAPTFGDIKDDAFAGYTTNKGLSDAEEAEEGTTNSYGVLADAATESFHTYFHEASLANSEMELIKSLAKAVEAVPGDTPESVKKEYYSLAKDMLKRRKATNLRYLDLERAEMSSNIAWLINPKLPKTGGFNAMVQRAAAVAGSRLAKDTPPQIKAAENINLGKKLKNSVSKERAWLDGFDGFDGMTSSMTYIGLGLLGLVIAGVVHHYLKKPKTVTAKKHKRK